MKQYKNITFIILGVITLINFQVYSQPKYTKSKSMGTDGDTIYHYAEQFPEFPGGIAALKKHIYENLKWPEETWDITIHGNVYLRFEVKKTGEIGKIELQKGIDPLIDKEAIKVIKSLPKFKPGEQNGKKVNVWYSLPIRIHLD